MYTLDFNTALSGAAGYVSVEPKDINTNSGYGAAIATALVSGQSSPYSLSFAGTGDTVALKFVLPATSAPVGSMGTISAVVVRRIHWVEQEVLVTVCEDKDDYRFGMNTQEKTNEIAGTGNHTTALFWEYDTRLGRRWNLDPKGLVGLSHYSTFSGDPIIRTDVMGDQDAHEIRTRRMEQMYLNGQISDDELKSFYRANGYGALIGAAAVLTFYTGGRAMPLLRTLTARALLSQTAIRTASSASLFMAKYGNDIANFMYGALTDDPTEPLPSTNGAQAADAGASFSKLMRSKSGAVLDFFGGESSKYAGAISIDPKAIDGFKGTIQQFTEIFGGNRFTKIIADNPYDYAGYLKDASKLLEKGVLLLSLGLWPTSM